MEEGLLTKRVYSSTRTSSKS